MKYLIIAAIALSLSGCWTTKVTTQYVHTEISVPDQLLQCDVIKPTDFPDPATLTNEQVHDIVLRLYRDNKVCASNMSAIKQYIKRHNINIASLNTE